MSTTLLEPTRVREDLLADRARLAARLGQLAPELDGYGHGDVLDQSTFAISRDQSAGLIAATRDRMTAIDEALERLEPASTAGASAATRPSPLNASRYGR